MSSVLFDAGDFQRLDRERTLIEQRERVPIEPDRSPIEEDENPFELLVRGIVGMLSERGLQ